MGSFSRGKLIAQVVREWRQSGAAKPVPAHVKAALEFSGQPVPAVTPHGTIDRVMVALHRAGKFTVASLVRDVGWGLKEYKFLPALLHKRFTSAQYRAFTQCLKSDSTTQQQIDRKKPALQDVFRLHEAVQQAQGSYRSDARFMQKDEPLQFGPKVLAEADCLLWDFKDSVEEVQERLMCKRFRISGTWELFYGMVAARAPPDAEHEERLKVVYDDGDSEDLDLQQFNVLHKLYVSEG